MNEDQAGGADVSIIITALNEERDVLKAVTNTINAFEEYKVNGEVVFVNDGSTDKTGDIIRKSYGGDKRFQFITHKTPRGVGASFWEGVETARGNVVAWLPGDNQTDPWEVIRYHSLLDHVDIVIPFIYNTGVRSLFRRTLSIVYRFIINTSFSTNFNYTNGSILYRKSVLKQLPYRSSSFFFQTDILITLTKKGCLFAEVPFRLDARDFGHSKAVTFPSFFKVARGFLRLVIDYYSKKRGKDLSSFSTDTQTAKRYKGKG